MKQSPDRMSNIKVGASVLLIVALLGIWILPPLIPSLSMHFPFDTPLNRLMLTTIVAGLGWLLIGKFNYERPHTKAKKNERDKKAVKLERKNLQTRFLAALASLKSMDTHSNFGNKHSDQPNQKLFNLPWVLMIGATQSGKSSLLSRSGIKFLLSKKNNLATTVITRTSVCEWWACPQAVVLDTAGRFTKQEQDDSGTAVLWRDFLDLLKEHRQLPINALLLTVSLEGLFTQTVVQQNDLIANLKKRILEVQKILPMTVPTYLIFTHADCVAGFNEFFDDLKTLERQQAWGICFSKNQITSQQRISDTFDVEFDRLLERLNERVITRLHHEPHQEKRALIKEFPLQMEIAKRSISRILHQLANVIHTRHKTQLRGLFFTSTLSKNKTHDKLMVSLSKSFDIEPYTYRSPIRSKKTYFIKQLFDEFLFKDAANYHTKPANDNRLKKITRRVAIAASACAIVLGTFYWSHSIANNIIEIKKVEDYITRYQILRENKTVSIESFSVPTMDLLLEINHLLDNIQLPLVLRVSIDRHYNLQGQAKRAYSQAVKKFVVYQLENTLKNESAKGSSADVGLLYGALKSYLSLSDQKHFDPQYTQQWFLQNVQSLPLPVTPQKLQKHIDALTQADFGTLHYNPSLVVQARQTILQTPLSRLAIAILKSDLTRKVPMLTLNKTKESTGLKIFTDEKNYQVPGIFTAKYFTNTYEKLLPQAVNLALQGNWVVGRTHEQNTLSANTLLEQTQEIYFHDYIKAWDTLLADLKLVSFDNIQYAIQLIDTLSQANSQVGQLLAVIRTNTGVTFHQIQTPVSIHFQPFNRFFNANATPSWDTVQYQLRKFQDVLINISSGQPTDKVAFQMAKARFQDKESKDSLTMLTTLANNIPAPINQWIFQVSDNSWGIILSKTKNYIDSVYQPKVYAVYQNKIKGYFPIDKLSKRDVRLDDFAQFFGPAGVMDSFFIANLTPFIDSTTPQWQWRQLNGKQLPMSAELLPAFQRAADIRQAWFAENPRQPQARFQMEALALQPIVKALTVSLDGQRTVFKQNSTTTANLIWPTVQPLHGATAQFSSVDGQHAEVSEEGLWAWFKILNKSVIQSSQGSKLTFTLEAGGYGGRCLLSSNSPVNPFSPQLLPEFSLPGKV